MLKHFYLIISMIACNISLMAQTEQEAIRATLDNYLEGSSYNSPELLKKAFYAEARLYLNDNKNKPKEFTSEEYADLFDKSKAGQFNGRVGNILSIDQFHDVALAKAEIIIPARQWRFIDMFLLKKLDGEWKIISKTASKETSNKNGKRILFIVSNAHHYGSSELPAGNSFSELVFAYDTFDKAGYHVDFVSPEGGAVPLAYINPGLELHKNYLYNERFMHALAHTYSPDMITASDYRAVHYIGGSSAMYGVPESESIQNISMEIFEEHNGIVSAVCHGTAGIVNLKTKDGKYLVAGRTVSGYPESYENAEAEYFRHFPFLIQKTIEDHGGTFKNSAKGNAHVEADGRIITGQNHLSSRGVAQKIIELLKDEPLN